MSTGQRGLVLLRTCVLMGTKHLVSPSLHEPAGLTGRERCLQRLADGLTAKAIARRLGISARTVHSHRAHVNRKRGVADRVRPSSSPSLPG